MFLWSLTCLLLSIVRASIGILMITGLLLDLLSGRSKSKAAPQGGMSWKPRVTIDRAVPSAISAQGGRVGKTRCWGQHSLSVPDMVGWEVRLSIHLGPCWKEGCHELETCIPPAVIRPVLDASPKLTWSPCTPAEHVWGFPGDDGPSQGLRVPPGFWHIWY